MSPEGGAKQHPYLTLELGGAGGLRLTARRTTGGMKKAEGDREAYNTPKQAIKYVHSTAN